MTEVEDPPPEGWNAKPDTRCFATGPRFSCCSSRQVGTELETYMCPLFCLSMGTNSFSISSICLAFLSPDLTNNGSVPHQHGQTLNEGNTQPRQILN